MRVERLVFWGLPGLVLLAAYIGVCMMAGTAWPWTMVVHEDGAHTLLGTVFYFEHAARELVPDAVLAIGVAGAVRFFFPPDPTVATEELRRWRLRLGLLAGSALALILGGTWWREGGQAIVDNLSQLHTRAGAPLAWGAHWRYHVLERLAQILAAFSAVGIIWIVRGRPDRRRIPGRLRMFGSALALFCLTTLLFGLTREPFQDPAYLGHQLRELFTHGLVTLPLALGVCLELAGRFSPAGATSSEARVWPIALTGGLSVILGGFLLAASVQADAQTHGQTSGLAALLFPHFAEHALGYLFVPSLAGALYLAARRGQSAG